MTKRFGFTLAEVLITLGIIGVVAAMTIPTLIANTNGAKFRSQFKKTISTLNQAGLMAQAQYDFDYAGTTTKCGSGKDADGNAVPGGKEHPDSTMSFCAILNGTLTGQTYVGAIGTGDSANLKRNNNGKEEGYKLVTKVTIPDTYTTYIAYTLADGSIVAFNPNATGCELPIGTPIDDTVIGAGGALANCVGFIDVNGVTLPNREVTCSAADDKDGNSATNQKVQTPCAVKNDANHMTDVFPVVFHDATVEPASNAAKYVLTSSK
ncbi:MAG: type II secretion system protein [Candidatus Gastranaerophilaceae bacterium]